MNSIFLHNSLYYIFDTKYKKKLIKCIFIIYYPIINFMLSLYILSNMIRLQKNLKTLKSENITWAEIPVT